MYVHVWWIILDPHKVSVAFKTLVSLSFPSLSYPSIALKVDQAEIAVSSYV